jgi:hypothetical protein
MYPSSYFLIFIREFSIETEEKVLETSDTPVAVIT